MKTAVRWILVVPVSFLAYAAARIIQNISTYPFMPDLISYLNGHPDFGPFTIWAPLYVFSSQCVCAALSIYAAGRVAPTGRERLAKGAIAGLWAISAAGSLVMMYFQPYPANGAARTYVGMIAEATGVVIALKFRIDE